MILSKNRQLSKFPPCQCFILYGIISYILLHKSIIMRTVILWITINRLHTSGNLVQFNDLRAFDGLGMFFFFNEGPAGIPGGGGAPVE